jgi:hypothetical protein
MKWFRFWTDTLDDVKILQLSDYEYRMWTYLLAIASEVNSMSGECQVNVKSMSLRCRTQVNHFLRALETFQKLELITINDEGYPVITNWNKRQYKSDNVTARVHKHREVTTKRNVSCNVSETHQRTDTDTETDKRIKIKKEPIPKIQFLDSVFLTQIEYDKLIGKHGKDKTDRAIEILNNGIMSKGYKYKSHYHTLIGWPMKEVDGNGKGANGIVGGDARPWIRRPGQELSGDAQRAIDDVKRAEREWAAKQTAPNKT